MGLRFRKSISVLPGVKINLGKTGVSVSVGAKGIHHTIHSSGRRTSSIGIPGTGISYVKTSTGSPFSKKDEKEKAKKAKKTAEAAEKEAVREAETKEEDQQDIINREKAENYQELIDSIRSIHEECSAPINWQKLYDAPAPSKKRKSMTFGSDEAEKLSDGTDDYASWEATRDLAKKMLDGDIDTYFAVLSEFNPFDKILDFGSDFDVGTDDPSVIEIEFHAKTEEVVPKKSMEVTYTGRFKEQELTKTVYYDIVEDYVCSCVLRLAREMFALLPVKKVAIHAVDKLSTGEEATVVSCLFDRARFETLPFDDLDPSDALESFILNMDFKKTKGFMPVERVDF